MAKSDADVLQGRAAATVAEPPVAYDVERGLIRHRRLVAESAALPPWATSDARRAPFGRHARWGMATLVLTGTLLWSQRAPRNEDVVAHDPTHASSPEAEPQAPGTKTTPIVPPTRAAHGASTQAPERAPQPSTSTEPTEPLSPARVNPGPPTPVHTRLATPPAEPSAQRSAGSVAVNEADDRPAPPAKVRDRGTGGGNVRGVAPADEQEIRLLSRARAMLPVDPLRTLRLAREGHTRFPRGYLRQERRYLEIRALLALGRTGEASAHALWFAQDYPDGPYTREIQRTLAQYEAP